MTRPRVLFVTESLGIGGAERQALQVMEQFVRRGVEVEVCVLGRDGPLTAQLQARAIPCTVIARRGPVDLWCLAKLTALLRARTFTAIEGLLHYSNVYAMVAGRLASIPIRVASNVGDRSLFVTGGKKQRLMKRISYRFATAIFANSAFVADADPEMQPWASKVKVIHNGLRAEAFVEPGSLGRPDLPMGRPLVGTVGRLAEAKDYPTFLRLIARVRERVPQVLGVVVGGGPLEDELRRLTVELDLDGHVFFAGMVHDPRPWLHAFDVFVLTSSRESLPNALMEAMAAGRPVVATRAAGIPELVEEGATGVTCPVGDVDAMALAVTDLLEDTPLRTQWGERAREVARNRWLWDEQIEPYLQMLAPRGEA